MQVGQFIREFSVMFLALFLRCFLFPGDFPVLCNLFFCCFEQSIVCRLSLAWSWIFSDLLRLGDLLHRAVLEFATRVLIVLIASLLTCL